MIKDSSGAEVGWDWQIGTFFAVRDGVTFGISGVLYRTPAELEAALGVTLSIESKQYMENSRNENPYKGPRRTVTKLQFMSLFRQTDLDKIYLAALGGPEYPALLTVRVRQAQDRIDRAEGNMIDLEAPETVQGLIDFETAGLITAGDADRIQKGQSWA